MRAHDSIAIVGESHNDGECGGHPENNNEKNFRETSKRSFSKYNTLYLMLFCVSYPCNKIDVSGQFAGRIEKTDIGPKSSLP